MVIYRLLNSGSFHLDAEGVEALTTAYERACAALDLVGHPGPLTDTIAKIIIERAKNGELDPVRLCEAVLEEIRSHS